MVDLTLVREALTDVFDPELGLNVIELGLIYNIAEGQSGDVVIAMTMTTKGCPMHDHISEAVQWAALQVPHVASVRVDVIWDPPWSPERMTSEAKEKLGWTH